MAGRTVATACLIVAAIGVGGVAAAWWLGGAAYGRTAGVVAGAVVAVETIGVAYSHMAVTDVAMTALVTVSLALAVTQRLEWAGVAAGLAASAKYPAVFLVAPLLVAGWRQWRRLVISLGLAALAFFATSPFVLVHPHQAWSDASRVQRLARDGWLGFEHDSWALFRSPGSSGGLGPGARDLGGRPRSRSETAEPHRPDPRRLRARLPRRPADDPRAFRPLRAAARPAARRARRPPALSPTPTLGLLIVPLVWAIGDDVRLTRTDTRVVAHRWLVAHLPARASVAADSSTPPIGRRVLDLQLPGPGRPHDPNRATWPACEAGV